MKQKNNLRIVNLIVSGKLPIKERFTDKEVNKLIMNHNWFSPREDNILFSKQFNYRKKELNVHDQQKNPYVTIWFSGAIVIVGLRSKKEANEIYDLVLKDLNKIKKTLKTNKKDKIKSNKLRSKKGFGRSYGYR